MNAETEKVHRYIEKIAAAWLDLDPLPDDKRPKEWPSDVYSQNMALNFNVNVMNALGDGIEFAPGQEAVLSTFERPGKELLLMMATAMYVGFLKAPSEQCEHIARNPMIVMTERTTVHVGLRQWICERCYPKLIAMEKAHRAEIDADKACDVCGQESDLFMPYIIPVKGTILISFHVGTCCEELLTYIKPDAEYTKTPRNAPCPCGSGQKFKYCHGSPNIGRHGMGKPGNN